MKRLFAFGAIGVLAVFTASSAPLPGSLNSPFTRDTEGWEVRGAADGPMWNPADGNPDGCVVAVGNGGPAWYWRAPAAFHGDLSRFYGRQLQFDARLSGYDRGGKDDVILQGGGVVLVHDNRTPPAATWTTHTVRLDENAGWQRVVEGTRVAATRTDFRVALGSVNELLIRGSSGDAGGEALLDNVKLNAPAWALRR